MPFKNIRFPSIAFGLMTFIALFVVTSFTETASAATGLIIDQPAGVVMKPQSGMLKEIAERITAKTPDLAITVLHAKGDGTFLTRSGSPANLDAFETLWIFQGDTVVQNTPLFSKETVAAILQWSQKKPARGILLTGGAAALFDQLGYGPVKTKPVTFGDDRGQAGLVPVQPNAKIFANVDSDRGTLWITNASFCAFDHFETASKNIALLARTSGGSVNPLLAGLTDQQGKRIAKVLLFGWMVGPLYYEAPATYRNNFETLLANLLHQAGKELVPGDTVAPEFTLPNFAALRRAIDDLLESYGDDYSGSKYLTVLTALEKKSKEVKTAAAAAELQTAFDALQRDALLANPALDFDEIVFLRRNPSALGFPQNYNSNSVLRATGYKNEIGLFNLRNKKESLLYKPEKDEFVGDLELHYDADRILFSMPDAKKNFRWRVWELGLKDGKPTAAPSVVPLVNDDDVDNYDACYLPDGRMIFCSTACFTGVPCIDGSGHVCNLYLKEKNNAIRQLTIEQDHDWCPTVMNNGRIMYLRWEYTDLPHAFSRIMFHMNPDGTNQSELYGSGSEWPNAMFYARPIPEHPTKFVAIVTGHHEQNRIGDLVVFDPALGRCENEGAVQRIPGYGKKVEATTLDLPIGQTWPKFVHPYPINEKYFLVSCKRTASAPWTLCLVDVFDNIVTLKEEPSFALFEPIPFRKTERQAVIPDRYNPAAKDADVFIADIYTGQGLKGIPRGTVKSLRIFSYEFSYQGMGAEPHSVGLDGPWDPKRVIGTVPVYEDGSAAFKIPAYTPIALQPLDAEGKAIQLMRSWITAMPGESVSCIGCHEKQNETSPTTARTIAAQRPAAAVTPFYGPTRGFSFSREIQPILDRYCLECHQPDSQKVKDLLAKQGLSAEKGNLPFVPDFRTGPSVPLTKSPASINTRALFSPSYYQLRRFVRTPTKESQMTVLKPYEFHADTTRLMQVLNKGHYGVQLDSPSWDRIITWIDLNAPYHGNWGDIRNDQIADRVTHQWKRRNELRKLYTGFESMDDDPTAKYATAGVNTSSANDPRNIVYKNVPTKFEPVADGYKKAEVESIPLEKGISLDLVTIPGTKFKMGRFEVTNEQFRLFAPGYDSGIEFGDFIHFSPGEKGYPLYRAKQPVIRVTWQEATEFCKWLGDKTGRKFALPTAEQWRYAAAAGTKTPFWFGEVNADYTQKENLGDSCYAAINPFSWPARATILPTWRPADLNRDDRSRDSAPVGSWQANPWQLFDMIGNAAEWTATDAVPENGKGPKKKVICGGSWMTPAFRSTIDSSRTFLPFAGQVDVGFRVICLP